MSNNILTLAQIEDALANTRNRGAYAPVITAFFESGDLSVDMTEKFPGKVAASLRNSVEQNAKKCQKDNEPTFKTLLMKDDAGVDHVLLVNLDAVAKARQATESEAE